jgi:hypothetical protein
LGVLYSRRHAAFTLSDNGGEAVGDWSSLKMCTGYKIKKRADFSIPKIIFIDFQAESEFNPSFLQMKNHDRRARGLTFL